MQHDSAITNPAMQHYYDVNAMPQRLTTKINSLDYNMSHKYRGFCIIIDIENFKKLPRRQGSQVDSGALFNLFRAMSFEVIVLKDLTYKEIRSQLERFSKIDHTEFDCFACCVMTHGEHGQLWAKDIKFPINTVFNFFLGDACPTLAGKPKMFFIQACQGERLDNGVHVYGDAEDSSVATYFKIPTHADFLIAYSTLPGFYSWRNTQDGSWFIQAVVRVFGQYHHEADLLTMLTIVNHQVAYYKQSNATTPDFSDKKQVPCITSMLTRRVFLRPKSMLN